MSKRNIEVERMLETKTLLECADESLDLARRHNQFAMISCLLATLGSVLFIFTQFWIAGAVLALGGLIEMIRDYRQAEHFLNMSITFTNRVEALHNK